MGLIYPAVLGLVYSVGWGVVLVRSGAVTVRVGFGLVWLVAFGLVHSAAAVAELAYYVYPAA